MSTLFSACNEQKNALTFDTIKVDAPFDMPTIQIPNFNNCEQFSIVNFGAVKGDKDKNALAIASAISEAHKIGGGTVVIPEGEWITKKLHFKSNVNLHLSKGAVLLFSGEPEDYLPAVHTTWEGMECYNYSPLIYAYECKNIAITGEGQLEADMSTWEKWFPRPKAHMNSLKHLYNLSAKNSLVEERQMVNDSANLRPQFIQFNRSEHILLEGVTIKNSPFWTIHPYLSKDVVIRNVNVYAHGHNNDGVDPEMSQNMLIEDCVFDQGDDAIAVKSGRNQDAWRLDTPTKNVVIRNSIIKNGHQLLAIGSELSGGVENVYMDNCEVLDGAKLGHLVFIKTNERRGGYVKNIHVKNIKCGKIDLGVLGIQTDVLYQWRDLVPTYETRLTPISDIYLENFDTKDVKFITNIQGQEAEPVKNIHLKNISCKSVEEDKHMHQNLIGFSDTK
ncbi:glycoside hydrolase family 28 protein [Formosa sp. 4Alg 33]|uniref:glycoside hydrolase family 28 protein n=1 Tax=Formosa sp. 4Alg 33 TaxID=3382189 RepID=UPI003D9C0F58